MLINEQLGLLHAQCSCHSNILFQGAVFILKGKMTMLVGSRGSLVKSHQLPVMRVMDIFSVEM